MKLTMKKTAIAAFVALILTGCGSSSHNPSQPNNPRQHSQPTPTVKAIDYSKNSLQQLQADVIEAKTVVNHNQTKVTQAEQSIRELNQQISVLNQDIRNLEAEGKTVFNKTLHQKRKALEKANKALAEQTQLLNVLNKDLKQAVQNLTNAEKLLITKQPVTVQPQPAPKPEAEPQPEAAPKPELALKPEEAPKSEEAPKPEAEPQPELAPKPEAAPKPEPIPRPEQEKATVDLQGNEWRKWENINPNNVYSYSRFPKYSSNYDGPREDLVIAPAFRDSTLRSDNDGYFNGLDFDQIAKQDEYNPSFYGWHSGYVESEGIVGMMITEIENGRIIKAERPEKFHVVFKNTPYTTYGALYTNENDVALFISRGSAAIFGKSDNGYSIGDYWVNEYGVKTTRMDFIDSVKGSATYKGDVLARVAFKDPYKHSLPFKDGDITINVNFGKRAEETFSTATLNSSILGDKEFDKSRLSLIHGNFSLNNKARYENNKGELELHGRFVGKDAAEVAGTIKGYDSTKNIERYNAVFSATKQ